MVSTRGKLNIKFLYKFLHLWILLNSSPVFHYTSSNMLIMKLVLFLVPNSAFTKLKS